MLLTRAEIQKLKNRAATHTAPTTELAFPVGPSTTAAAAVVERAVATAVTRDGGTRQTRGTGGPTEGGSQQFELGDPDRSVAIRV